MTASCVRLWCGYRVGRSPVDLAGRQRLPKDVERAFPESFFIAISPVPTPLPEEVWLGMYVANATRLGELNTQVEGAGLDEN